MKDILEFLTNNPIGTLATVGLDNKPKIRPFTFFFEKEGKLWFETSNEKDVFNELVFNHPEVNPAVARADDDFLFSARDPNGVLRYPGGNEVGAELRPVFDLLNNVGKLVKRLTFCGGEIMESGAVRTRT